MNSERLIDGELRLRQYQVNQKAPYSPSRSDTSAKDFAPFEENRKAAYEEMLDRMEQSGVSMDTFALTNPAIRGYAEEFGIYHFPLKRKSEWRMFLRLIQAQWRV